MPQKHAIFGHHSLDFAARRVYYSIFQQMGTIFFIIIFLLALASSGAMGARTVFNGFSNLNPGKAKVQADFRKIQAELAKKRAELVPWSDEDRSLLSLKRKPYKERTGSVKSAEGTFISIYQEPMVHFAYKRYLGKKENAIMVVMTSHHEYLYRIKNNHVEVALNGKYLGGITPDFALVSDKKKTMAKIDTYSNSDYYPITVEGREVGSVGDVKKAKKVNPRAFELLAQLSPNEEKKMLALAFYFLVRNGFEKI